MPWVERVRNCLDRPQMPQVQIPSVTQGLSRYRNKQLKVNARGTTTKKSTESHCYYYKRVQIFLKQLLFEQQYVFEMGKA